MDTLGLCRRFFETHGHPLLQREFPEVMNRIAAARIGGGSDVLGADDEHSRDDAWGPTFQVFMPDGDYRQIGPRMREVVNRAVPPEFEGHPTAAGGGPSIDVFGIRGFMRERLGLGRYPHAQSEWLDIPEGALRQFIGGEVFYDPSQKLSGVRAQFAAYYPPDVWRLLIARAAYACWFYGEHNYPGRLAPRGDQVTGLVARGRFCEAAMRLTFLLNHCYAPYWKWLHWEFRRLPAIAPELEPIIERVAAATDMHEQASSIVAACTLLRRAIREQGVVPSDARMDYLGAFDAMRTLEDAELARQPVRSF